MSSTHSPQYHYNRGLMLQREGAYAQAEELYLAALEQQPNYPLALNNLATLKSREGLTTDAEELLRRALEIDSHNTDVLNNLGCILRDQGRHEESVACFRQALHINPDCLGAASNLLLTLNYFSTDPAQLAAEHAALGQAFQRCAPSPNAKPKNRRASDPLRIGYVSANLNRHSVSYFIEPILANHDRHLFEPYCYSDSNVEDEISERLRSHAYAWRPIYGRSHRYVAEMIIRDKIDILIDLAGHAGPNRLPVFAARPAHVNITYLGYPGPTGLSAIDYRITDEIIDPIGGESVRAEQPIRLPGGFLCYAPPPAPPPSEPPMVSRGAVTFGSFNSLPKITPEVVDCWAEVLKATPRSRLVLKTRGLADGSVRNRLLQSFGAAGIETARIELLGAIPTLAEHLESYTDIDIALDTFPYNGTTTTCEALWMGVPVVSLCGTTHAGRVGKNLLTRVGLAGMAADNRDSYVALAAYLASDQERLCNLRLNMRTTIADSRLCDGFCFVRDYEEALLRALASDVTR